MSRHHKGVLGFSILYTVLFVFDGAKLLASVMPSAIANYLKYLVYVVLALYGSFLFKDRLILQWNEIRKTKRKFFFGVLTGWLFLILMTVVFGFVSEWTGAVGYLGGGLAFSIIYVKEKENIYYPLFVHMLGNSLSFIILALS